MKPLQPLFWSNTESLNVNEKSYLRIPSHINHLIAYNPIADTIFLTKMQKRENLSNRLPLVTLIQLIDIITRRLDFYY